MVRCIFGLLQKLRRHSGNQSFFCHVYLHTIFPPSGIHVFLVFAFIDTFSFIRQILSRLVRSVNRFTLFVFVIVFFVLVVLVIFTLVFPFFVGFTLVFILIFVLSVFVVLTFVFVVVSRFSIVSVVIASSLRSGVLCRTISTRSCLFFGFFSTCLFCSFLSNFRLAFALFAFTFGFLFPSFSTFGSSFFLFNSCLNNSFNQSVLVFLVAVFL